MKNLSIISSLVYAILTAIYFIFGKDDSSIWSAYYFVNTGLYICLLLISNLWKENSIKRISLIIAAIAFQVLFIALEIYLVVWCSSEYFKLINSVFWSSIAFVVVIIYLITNKILDQWVNG